MSNVALNRRIQRQAHQQKHLEELQTLGYTGRTLIPLRRLENKMHFLAEQACNGEITDEAYECCERVVTEKIARLFGGTAPRGFFVNGDPRGYALKIDDDKVKGFYKDDHLIMDGTEDDFMKYILDHTSHSYDHALKHEGYRIDHPLSRTDWGGYGILAPEF